MILLTDDEIQEKLDIANKMVDDLVNSTEGHFKQEGIDAIFFGAYRAMAKAQAKKIFEVMSGCSSGADIAILLAQIRKEIDGN